MQYSLSTKGTRVSKIKILIVEDESIIALNLKETLIELGYEPCGITPNKCKTIAFLEKGVVPDLILMDIYLKGPTTGIKLAQELKATLPYTPIIFLTANSELATIKEASEAFAYGYIVKPYKKTNLHAAIEVALKKAKDDKEKSEKYQAISNTNEALETRLNLQENEKLKIVKLKYGYVFDKEKEMLFYENKPIKLTLKEKQIIQILCQSPGQTISQEQLEHSIWSEKPPGYAAFRSLLFRLREKIHKDLITNQSNTGYKIELL